MKPLNIFWIGVGLMVMMGISDQFGFSDVAIGFLCASLFTMITAAGIALSKNS